MISWDLVCVGKIKEKYLDDAISEYLKRIKPYCNFKITEIREINTPDMNKNLLEEGKNILQCISDND